MDVNDLKRLFQGAKKSEAHLLLNCWFEQQTSRSHPISPIVESSSILFFWVLMHCTMSKGPQKVQFREAH